MERLVVFITGTSTGLGRTTALHLARKGHRVFATMRSPQTDAAALLAIARDEHLSLSVSRLDVTDEASIECAVRTALDEAGAIDVLVNNAGLCVLTAVELATEAQTHAMFETNVFGPMRVMRAVLPAMRARGRGTIVNVSSISTRCIGVGSGLYAATKQALEALSEALALEAGPFGVRVAIIEPGFFETPILDKVLVGLDLASDSPYAAVERRVYGIYAGGRSGAGDPQEVADAIEHAIITDDPKLRYIVGAGGMVFARERARMGDEEYVRAFSRAMSDEEFFAEFGARFPMS
jgi:NAD(P)-dependent dehydrogenase (short-subunit alcohol dehydrogenase family)